MKTLFIKNLDTFKQINSGTKTIEIRKKSSFMDDIQLNNSICFCHGKEICIVKIVGIRTYPSFDSLIDNAIRHGLSARINSNITNKNNARLHYANYYNSTDFSNSFIAIEFGRC